MATTDIEKVRVLIPDTEAVFGPAENQTLFSDDDIQKYIDVASGSLLRAAGYAVLAMANSEAIISKVIKTQDLSTNGAQVAEALRKSAQALFDRADTEDSLATEFYIDIVDIGPSYPPELTEWDNPLVYEEGYGRGGFGN